MDLVLQRELLNLFKEVVFGGAVAGQEQEGLSALLGESFKGVDERSQAVAIFQGTATKNDRSSGRATKTARFIGDMSADRLYMDAGGEVGLVMADFSGQGAVAA